jgi:hypothetical protein
MRKQSSLLDQKGLRFREASKEIEDVPHLGFAEWINRMNPSAKRAKTEPGSLATPWRLHIGIFKTPFLMALCSNTKVSGKQL